MAYSKEELFEKAKKAISENNLIFAEDVIAYLGIAKATYYLHFKDDSDEMNILRGMLEENKIKIKISLRKKWFDSDNATLQMALYKLSSNDIEHKKLQQNYTDVTTKDEALNAPQTIVFRDYNKEIDD